MSYYIKALILGVGWIPVLWLNPSTGAWLRDWNDPIFFLHCGFLILTSVILASLFKEWITSAEDRFDHLLRAAALPFVGCVIYISFYNFWAASVDFSNVGRVNFRDGLVLYFWSLFAAAQGFPIVIAYGYVCQRFLTRGGNDTPEASGASRLC